MNSETIVYCVVALILGMLLAHMLKSVCGCNKVVEGSVKVGDDNADACDKSDDDCTNSFGRTGGGPCQIPGDCWCSAELGEDENGLCTNNANYCILGKDSAAWKRWNALSGTEKTNGYYRDRDNNVSTTKVRLCTQKDIADQLHRAATSTGF